MTIQFGSCFKYRGDDYVFLAQTEEVTYAAKILTKEDTGQINSRFEKKSRDGSWNSQSILYCYVMLTTPDFQDRMAHFKDTAKSELEFDEINVVLNQQDLEEIKQEILGSTSAVPNELKSLVKDISIP